MLLLGPLHDQVATNALDSDVDGSGSVFIHRDLAVGGALVLVVHGLADCIFTNGAPPTNYLFCAKAHVLFGP